ncbi:MAG: kinase-like domain-containing protein [Benniella sp.]|nr:MAG: kinase-like domain-containing protein [Benniella sp.]
MERISSSGSMRRPSSIHSGSGYIPTSPISSAPPAMLHDDQFSNNPEDYDIRLPIGYGSSAVVYDAFYKPLNRRVAIKVIDLDMFERNQIDELRRETQVMALCKHPNVLRVNGAFVADSKLYIVTPYLSAGSCLDIMKTAHPDGFDEISIATILKQADVKAGNLLMDDDGSVLLADFGVSSSLMENGDRRGTRKTFVGTPCWMAPEVMEQAGYDYKADIWSFGITAIELATGHAPFAKYPPIKVLMLTLSNDPPTLDRESTKHRYSKLLKEMIDSCLQKDPARRPSAEKLLSHSFFKQAKKKSYLVQALLHNLPPLEQRPPKKAPPKATLPQKGVSWDFDGDDDGEPVRRPRTVKFDTSDRPVSTATTDSISSAGAMGTPVMESRSLEGYSEDGTPMLNATPTSDKPVKKSRFVIEESPSSLAISPSPSNCGTDMNQSASAATSPSPSFNNIVPTTGSVQPGQGLHGLGVSSSNMEPISSPEVRRGRFSVKDTLSISSPSPATLKAVANEGLLSPSRSLSSSPIDFNVDGVQVGVSQEQGPLDTKSRFETHHNHPSPAPGGSANGAGLNSPVLTGASTFSKDSAPNSASTSSTGATQGKRSRFLVSSVEGKTEVPPGVGAEAGGSTHSTPNTSPSGSLSRGQGGLIDTPGTQSVHAHLDTLYRQNEQQRTILTELFAGLGLKPGSLPASAPSSAGSKTQSLASDSPIAGASTATMIAAMSGGDSVHRQDLAPGQGGLEKQLQATVRENESLRRENEALKRELDRLRRAL